MKITEKHFIPFTLWFLALISHIILWNYGKYLFSHETLTTMLNIGRISIAIYMGLNLVSNIIENTKDISFLMMFLYSTSISLTLFNGFMMDRNDVYSSFEIGNFIFSLESIFCILIYALFLLFCNKPSKDNSTN